MLYIKDKGLYPEPNLCNPFPGKVSILGGGYLAISRVAPHKEEAMEFLKFIETQDSQGYLLRELGWMPTRPDAWRFLEEQKKKEMSGFIESLRYAQPRPTIRNYQEVSGTWQEIIYSILFSKTTVNEAIEKYGKPFRRTYPNIPWEYLVSALPSSTTHD